MTDPSDLMRPQPASSSPGMDPGDAHNTAAALEARVDALRAALARCPAEVPASRALPAQEGLDAVSERLALGVDHTVVALFGGTGSGKSSLFNALSELEFADVGARRPMTSRAAACTWGDDAHALLAFLGVDMDRRIRRESILDGADQDDLAGLVLLDVPDYDSVTTAHALHVERLVPLADILVWVLDPQKYADSALHNGYLRKLGARQEDMLILVNHIDTVPEGRRDHLLADVRALLEADGLSEVTVLPVSAVRGDNLDQVRSLLIDRVHRPSNAARTASAHLDQIATRLLPTVAPREVAIAQESTAQMQQTLLASSGATVVAESIDTNLRKLMPGALARPEPPARAGVEAARTRWLAQTTQRMPSIWARSVDREVVTAETLAAQTAEAVASVRLPASRSAGVEAAWWLGVCAVLAGFLWWVSVFAAGGRWWWPLLLSLVGLAVMVASYDGRRRRAKRESDFYAAAVRQRVAAVVARGVEDPAQAVLERHAHLRDALTTRTSGAALD